jgi:hypothetical protein
MWLATRWKPSLNVNDWNDEILDHLEHETRSEAEEAERDSAALAARVRQLADVAFDAMTNGDMLTVSTLGQSVTGRVQHARGNLVSLETAGDSIDINLSGPVSLSITQPASWHGHGRTRGAATFRARLAEYELTGEPVQIVAPLAGVALAGTIAAVAKDHIMIETLDEQRAFIPLTKIAFVSRHRR